MKQIVPVVLCGGNGTRLWPRSRSSKPKPFLDLMGNATLFRATLDRCPTTAGFAAPIIVTGQLHVPHVEKQLHASDHASIIVEPCSRNTAAAIALAAMRLPEDAIMLVCPSDHHIADTKAFQEAAYAAAQLANDGWLVSFGIEATKPETGFGYLKRGEPIGEKGFRTAQFVEKPDLKRAQSFLAEQTYAWNGGIFAFRAGDFLNELTVHRPTLAATVMQAVIDGTEEGNLFHPAPQSFAQSESESIDYAVMENTTRAAMVLVDMGWSDIGNWQALHAAREQDALGNAVKGPVELVDCRNVLVDSDGPRVSAIGLNDIYVVVDGNDIMITTAVGTQKVGQLSSAIEQ